MCFWERRKEYPAVFLKDTREAGRPHSERIPYAEEYRKRVLQTVIVLFCVSLMIFVLLRIIPGDAITTMMGEHANADTIARLTKEMNLDKPFYVQFITYLKDICTGNFGTSYTLNKPVTELLAAAFPNTVKLAVMAAVIAWVIGMVCGIIAAVKKDGILDRLFMGFSLLGVSVPVFMVAMVLGGYFRRQILDRIYSSGNCAWLEQRGQHCASDPLHAGRGAAGGLY